MVKKSLDQKLERIAADSSCKDFILADAKDADMGFGLAAPGFRRNANGEVVGYRTLPEYRQFMRDVTEQGLVDIMLISASTSEILTIEERLFDDSSVTAAVRANDTTDIWCGNTSAYGDQPSLAFHTTTIDHIQCGHSGCTSDERDCGTDVGLYSITFNNDAQRDREALEAYRSFRIEAESKNFRHFLEVFAPNATGDRPLSDVGAYVNDCIARLLGGITKSSRPVFLKIPYFGAKAMDALASYDPSLIVGILGGSAGTTHDAFHMLAEAKKYGARAALFGRKINNAEDQLLFVKYLRSLADGEVSAEEAVRAYHGDLCERGITPFRPLDEDLVVSQLPS